jgi:hypothetical protein
MSQTPIERLREYLAQLPPQSQALLMREFERALERGQDTAVATLVLEQLRKIARKVEAEEAAPARTDDLSRLLFRPLEPFLVEAGVSLRVGQIRRSSLAPIWQWLGSDGAPEKVIELEAALARLASADNAGQVEALAQKVQAVAASAIAELIGPGGGDKSRALPRIGPPSVIEDLYSIGAVLAVRDSLATLAERLPRFLRAFGDGQIAAVMAALNIQALQTPQMLPFALSIVIQRMTAPWQIIRLAVKIAASDDEIRVAATPYGVAVTITLHDLIRLAAALRMDIKRGRFDIVADDLKALHDGVRGLRTELDLRNDSVWGKQLTSIRADISDALQSEIDVVPGRIRRILRQRAEKDIPPAARIDGSEVEEAVALIDFVATCRNYAGELAINEVTLRTYSDLQQYVERSTETLVQSLRAADHKVRSYRQQQVKAAIRFCEVLFGDDYASLMRRAAENALTGEHKSSRAG